MSPDGRFWLSDAYVLHRRNYRETSLLLDVFTRDHGNLGLIAKGALRGKGRFGPLQAFLPLSLGWSGRGELPVLTAAEPRGAGYELSGKILYCGFYLNELLLKLLPARDSHPRIFESYENALSRLQNGDGMDETLRFFEVSLLEEIGYGLVLDCDSRTGSKICPEGSYLYRIEEGPVASSPGDPAIQGSTLLGLRDGHLPGTREIVEARRLMRRVINHHLNGRPLKSRELFKYSQIQESR